MMSKTVTTSTGVQMPRLIYGTAWKQERTTDLVVKAVQLGFRGIDTACQPKHYREDLIGKALQILQSEHNVERKDLFIQTKFTSMDGQDPKRIPYDPFAPLTEQVLQSFKRSLANLGTDYIDSLVMHSPMSTFSSTMEVWRVFEDLYSTGKVKQLGISNCYGLSTLKNLYEMAKVKPSVVQNRFYAETEYDKDIRSFCRYNNILYQSFWTLTANPHILSSKEVQVVSEGLKITPEQVMFRWLMDIGIVPLTGTTNEIHMKQDLQVLDLPSLPPDDIKRLNKLIGE